MSRYDVAIFGAGLAGLALAWNLEREGFRVCVLERSARPLQRAGEALVPAAGRILREMGLLDDFKALNFLPYVGNYSKWGNAAGQFTDFIHDPEGTGWFVERGKFEQLFIRKLSEQNVDIFWNTHVTDLSYSQGCWRVKSRSDSKPLHSQIVVDATGRRSAIKRYFSLKPRLYTSQVAHITHVPRMNEACICQIMSLEDAWIYTAPLDENQSVVAIHRSSRTQRLQNTKAQNNALLKRCDFTKNLILNEAAKWKIVPATTQNWPVHSGNNWFSIGDAAVAVDPLSSSGMFNALYTAIMAPRYILQDTHKRLSFASADFNEMIDNMFNAISSRILIYMKEAKLQL